MNQYKILYAEDHLITAEYTQERLEQSGFIVDPFNDGDDAWEAYISNQDYDLALLDYQMPGKNGLELYSMIRQKDKIIPILIISAYTEICAPSLGMGVDDFVRKDASIEEIVMRINIAIKRGYSNTPKNEIVYITLNTFFDKNRRLLSIYGKKQELNKIEAEIITLLCDNRNSTIASDFLCRAIWNNSVYDKGRQLQNYISKIRKIIEQDSMIKIISNYGDGYCLKVI